MAAIAKHFPGHGAVVADSHVALPVDRREFVDMESDLRPYRLLIENQLPGVMAAHVVYPAVDALPASLSRRWIGEILRGTLGFHGCVFTDDLSMARGCGVRRRRAARAARVRRRLRCAARFAMIEQPCGRCCRPSIPMSQIPPRRRGSCACARAARPRANLRTMRIGKRQWRDRESVRRAHAGIDRGQS